MSVQNSISPQPTIYSWVIISSIDNQRFQPFLTNCSKCHRHDILVAQGFNPGYKLCICILSLLLWRRVGDEAVLNSRFFMRLLHHIHQHLRFQYLHTCSKRKQFHYKVMSNANIQFNNYFIIFPTNFLRMVYRIVFYILSLFIFKT